MAVSESAWPSGCPLRLEGVRVLRGGRAILDGVDLVLEPGRRYVLVGASGSGKTTLLRLLNRLEDPASGQLLVGATPMRELPVRAVRAGVGLVFQAPRPLPGTVGENLCYPSQVRGRRVPEPAVTTAILEEFGLDPGWLGRDAASLSGGERQRLAIATALLAEPEILALDEPTSALDPAAAAKIADRLAERCRTGGLRTVVVTHQRELAPRLGEVAVMLQAGRIVSVGPVSEVLSRLDAGVWSDAAADGSRANS